MTENVRLALELDVERIRYELERIGKNQEWLAEQMGISTSSVSYFLKSRRPIRHAEDIGNVFGIDPMIILKTVKANDRQG